LISCGLLLLKVANQKDVIQKRSWSVLLLVIGTGVYMSVVMKLGGVQLIADMMKTLSNKFTVTPIYAFTGGFMSWFSYAVAVPIPGLIPTVSVVAESLGLSYAHELEIVVNIAAGAFVAMLSPFSMGGASVHGTYDMLVKPSDAERSAALRKQLICVIVYTLLACAFTGLGYTRIFV